ncbi:MAG: Uma2 family endonuclease [Chloroflexi bacterium]|nr:Uma2 family endonuclease [Chloroflexota bacterium]
MATVSAPPQLTTRRMTYAEYRAMPDDGKRYELVDGVLREMADMPAPTLAHQLVSRGLFRKLDGYVAERKLGQMLYAPVDVYLADDLSYQPDILFVANESRAKLTNDEVIGPPDLVVEIVSPASRNIDRKEKAANYANHGVREYWLVYPDAWIIEVLELKEGKFQLLGRYGEGETVRSEVLAGLEFLAETVFAA